MNGNQNTQQVQIEETKEGFFPEIGRSRNDNADY